MSKTSLQPERRLAAKAVTADTSLAGLPPRKLAKVLTRRKLLAAARKLFAERGYNATKPIDITRAAGVGYGNFYNCFNSKRDCYIEFVQDVSEEKVQIIDWFVSSVRNTPSKVLPVMLRVSFDYSIIHPGITQVMVSDETVMLRREQPKRLAAENYLIGYLEAWKKAGYAASHLDSELFCHMITGAFKEADLVFMRNSDRGEQIIQSFIDFIMFGLDRPRNKKAKRSIRQ